ncbi:MAG: hypothetical protein HY905_15965 [Deltaproteobacteria bacterium]|nr:hypothetical protein [Deltaproteobacteria bacterium]
MNSRSLPARCTFHLLPALFLLASGPARAADTLEPVPLLVGPVTVDATPVAFSAASYRVLFAQTATRASVELTVQVQAATEVVLGFAGRRVSGLAVTIDGAPAPLEYSIAPLAVAGGPFDSQILVRVPPSPAGSRTVVLTARCETAYRIIDAALTYPEASILPNLWLDGPRAHVLQLDPASAITAPLALRLETTDPQRPAGPVAAAADATPGGAALEGSVVAGSTAPFEVSAVEGEMPVPRRWGFSVGIGLALDFPHVENVARDRTSGAVTERWYTTTGFRSPFARMWLSGLFVYEFRDHWMFSTGLEGDPMGVLEIPVLFTWYPQAPPADDAGRILDYHVLFGLALQVFNDLSPGSYGFDPRPFIRLGAGFRFFVLTMDVAYEIAPPVGDWNGPYGLLEHKLLITFPFAF